MDRVGIHCQPSHEQVITVEWQRSHVVVVVEAVVTKEVGRKDGALIF